MCGDVDDSMKECRKRGAKNTPAQRPIRMIAKPPNTTDQPCQTNRENETCQHARLRRQHEPVALRMNVRRVGYESQAILREDLAERPKTGPSDRIIAHHAEGVAEDQETRIQ